MAAASDEPRDNLVEHCSLLREWLSLAGVEKAAIRDMVAKQVSELSHQHFDAQKLDALEEEPEWLQPMCAERRWRTLLYDLFAANPDCKLLKATVGELSKGEHASEVAAHPGLLALIGGASSLQAFLGSLGTQLHGRRHGHTMQEGLDGVACAGEAQFFFAQLLLRTAPLATIGFRTHLETAAARMADAAAATHGAAGARRLQLLAAGVPRESALLSSLVSVLIAGVITPADAQTLCTQSEMAISQSEMASSKSAPRGVDLRALRLPAVLRLLLQALFDPARPPKAETREWLLRTLASTSATAPLEAPLDAPLHAPLEAPLDAPLDALPEAAVGEAAVGEAAVGGAAVGGAAVGGAAVLAAADAAVGPSLRVGAAVRFREACTGAVTGATSGVVSEVPIDGAVTGTVIALHMDDPSAVYYTVRVDGTGAERQTTADRLEVKMELKMDTGAAAAASAAAGVAAAAEGASGVAAAGGASGVAAAGGASHVDTLETGDEDDAHRSKRLKHASAPATASTSYRSTSSSSDHASGYEYRYECALSTLRQAQAVCEKNEVSEIGASVALLRRCIHEPAAACGILHWTHVVLTTARFSGARYNASFAPDVIKLVLAIGARHGALCDAACTLLHACLVHEPETDSENNALSVVAVRRLLLDGLLLMLARGYALPVLTTLHTWIAGSDLSLTRHLLQHLVALVGPPYSRPFAARVLAIVRRAHGCLPRPACMRSPRRPSSSPQVRHPRTLEAHRGLEARQPLVSFAQQARAVAGLEETAEEVLALLQA